MNAATEYRRVLSEVQAIVERIPAALSEHAKRQESTPQYWSHAADMKKVRLDLLHTLAFLGDLESREALLAEGESR